MRQMAMLLELLLASGFGQWQSLDYIEARLVAFTHNEIIEALGIALKEGWVKQNQTEGYTITQSGLTEMNKLEGIV